MGWAFYCVACWLVWFGFYWAAPAPKYRRGTTRDRTDKAFAYVGGFFAPVLFPIAAIIIAFWWFAVKVLGGLDE